MKKKILLAIAIVAMAAVTANAAVISWDGDTSNDWFDGTNWNPDVGALAQSDNLTISSGTPYATGQVTIQNGGSVVINGGDVTWDSRRHYVGGTAGATAGSFLITSGSLNVNYTGSLSYPTLNIGDRAEGLFQIQGGIVDATGMQRISISGGGANGVLELSGGVLNAQRLGNGWDGSGVVHVIGDAAVINLIGEAASSQSYFQNGNSTLKLDIGSGISMIDAAAAVSLAGTLDVGFTVTPTVGQTFDIIQYGSLSGTFDTFETLVDSPNGLDSVRLSIDYNSGSKVVLTVVEIIPVVNVIYPLDEAEIYAIDVRLQWENMPIAGDVNVDVWLGTDPNKVSGPTNGTYEKVVDGGLNTVEYLAESLAPGVYYWQVDTMVDGDPNDGRIYTFTNLGTVESVELAADGDITWLNQSVSLAAIAEDESGSVLVYDWSYEPADDTNVILDVDINDNSFATLTVVNPDPSGQVLNVQVQVAVTVQGEMNDPVLSNTVNIEVHDDACLATRNGLGLTPKTDLNGDCVTNLADLAELAADWLVDYELKGPATK